MDIQAEKLLVIEALLQVDDAKIIERVRELLSKDSNPIVGFENDGKPLRHKGFIKKIELAEREFKAGKYQTIEELEKEANSW